MAYCLHPSHSCAIIVLNISEALIRKALTYIERGKFALIEAGKIDTTPLITRRFKLEDIEEAYRIFENKLDGAIKIAITP